jgi:hypothetical protein
VIHVKEHQTKTNFIFHRNYIHMDQDLIQTQCPTVFGYPDSNIDDFTFINLRLFKVRVGQK